MTINEKHLELTTQLLKKYKDMYFDIMQRKQNAELVCENELQTALCEVLDYTFDFDVTPEFQKMTDDLYSFRYGMQLLQYMNERLNALKSYPKYGEEYYTILRMYYFDDKDHTNEEIRQRLHYGNVSTIYRKKKAAIKQYTQLLWSNMILEQAVRGIVTSAG